MWGESVAAWKLCARRILKILGTWDSLKLAAQLELHEFWLNGDQLWSASKVHNSLEYFKFIY